MITVFGSINVDMVMRVGQLPAPGETVLCPGYDLLPGGKGANQALAARRAGASVALVGRVGGDGFAAVALDRLRRAGVDLAGAAPSPRPTGCAAVWVAASGENAIAVASGANLDAAAAQVPSARLGTDVLLLMQMEVPAEENWALVRSAKARGTRILLNLAPAAPVPEDILAKLDLLLVNGGEAAALSHQAGFSAERPEDIATTLAGRYGLACIVTLGAAGTIVVSPELRLAVPALPITPVDTTGAGDAFTGALAAALGRGSDLAEAARWGSVAAGLCCTVPGAQAGMPDRAMIERGLRDLPPSRPF